MRRFQERNTASLGTWGLSKMKGNVSDKVTGCTMTNQYSALKGNQRRPESARHWVGTASHRYLVKMLAHFARQRTHRTTARKLQNSENTTGKRQRRPRPHGGQSQRAPRPRRGPRTPGGRADRADGPLQRVAMTKKRLAPGTLGALARPAHRAGPQTPGCF